ncbi:hypothetical protein GCG21_15665 [Pseudactinotalea sp. HY160]|uniref:hypothetical protein n=1 Tax=Pseudactinotalea sp. HY160 TaxID=2654490 RepID=UPI00128B3882|nr:hypothetical protein [Pseudactinotalea sp. HY160]MPV51422.1 hypothetical protein [Pseudactinotalea sp. HY160]
MNAPVSLGGFIASVPHTSGYQPRDAITITGMRPADSSGGNPAAVLTGTAALYDLLGPVEVGTATRQIYEAFTDRGAQFFLVAAWTTSPDLLDHARTVTTGLEDLARADHTRDDRPGPAPVSVQVAGGAWRPLDGYDWMDLPEPVAAITDHFASPAPSREAFMAQVAPYPEPAYTLLGAGGMRALIGLPPSRAAGRVIAELDHAADPAAPARSQDWRAVCAHLLTRDKGTRDAFLAAVAAETEPRRRNAHTELIIETARGCPDPATRSRLYAVSGFLACISEVPSAHLDALLDQAGGQDTLAGLTRAFRDHGAPGDILRQSAGAAFTPSALAEHDQQYLKTYQAHFPPQPALPDPRPTPTPAPGAEPAPRAQPPGIAGI